MKEKTIKKLIRLVEESEIDQLEVTSWGRTVRITRHLGNRNGNSDQPAVVQTILPPQAPSQPAPVIAAAVEIRATEG
ncbi:MAG: acetyl-CoA carboxylase biotin carboxyl carrier protein, partial [candidate division Zixibacteria bacterium]|nr:acetyl-CoA carboxylase biotin carboxyl carrier protein [candidate division Zixibacteria bacterium]